MYILFQQINWYDVIHQVKITRVIKGALDKYNIIPNFFPKKFGFFTIRSVGMGNDCMLSFTFKNDLLLKKYEYF